MEKNERKNRVRQWVFSFLFKHGVLFSLILSMLIFAVYVIGSIPDPGISDDTLFLLLRLLWYSSLLLFIFSLFAVGIRVRRLVYNPSLRNIVGLFLYFAAALLGAGMAIINSLIVAASVGNV